MAAMPDEVYTIHKDIKFHQEQIHGERTYYFSRYKTVDMLLVNSRCGKVSAASTATSLIEKYDVDHIDFQKFIVEVASHYSSGIVQEYLKTL